MKMDMRDYNWWKSAFRYIITTLIYVFVIASVFFYISGDWSFLGEFQYYITTFSTYFFSMFLRYLWSDKGVTVALASDNNVKTKETAKRDLIAKVVEKNLIDKLDTYVVTETRNNKETSYRAKLDRKVGHLKRGWYKLFRKSRLSRWTDKRNEFINRGCEASDFNLDNIRVPHYKVTIDDILSVSHIQQSKDKRSRYNKSKMILSSYQTNILTFVGSAIVGGAQVILSKFQLEDLIILLSQIIIFTLNIYSGYNLGLNGILQNYSTDLSDDYVLLKKFLKENNV